MSGREEPSLTIRVARLWRNRCEPLRWELTPARMMARRTKVAMAPELVKPILGATWRRKRRRHGEGDVHAEDSRRLLLRHRPAKASAPYPPFPRKVMRPFSQSMLSRVSRTISSARKPSRESSNRMA